MYIHTYTIAFSVLSARKDASDVTPSMLRDSLQVRSNALGNAHEWFEAVGEKNETHKVQTDSEETAV
jgi:hypothetical protein